MIVFIFLVGLLIFLDIKEIKKDNDMRGFILYAVLVSFMLFLGITYISDPLGHTSISQYIFRIIGINY